MLCELCNKKEAIRCHHLIPRNILKKINPNSPLKKKKAMLCRNCEMECHYGFLAFLIEAEQCDGYNRVNAIKYSLLKRFLHTVHPNIYKKWVDWFKRFLDESFKEYSKENLRVKTIK